MPLFPYVAQCCRTQPVIVLLALAVSTSTSCISQKATPPSPSYIIASNSEEPLSRRIFAATQLSETERLFLQQKLVAELPGQWDKRTRDAIELLGEIGDPSVIGALIEVDETPNYVRKLHVIILDSIDKIKSRHSSKWFNVLRKKVSTGSYPERISLDRARSQGHPN